jgi:uncharacterized tellurite resistance protein B-like protein
VDFDTEVLKLAFVWHLLGELARADGAVTADERALADRVCPREKLVSAGLADAAGEPTDNGREARSVAADRLRDALSREQKLALLTQLFELCVVDGQMDREEGSLLFLAGSLLGVRPSELDAHLDTLTEHVGEVELDAPDFEAEA